VAKKFLGTKPRPLFSPLHLGAMPPRFFQLETPKDVAPKEKISRKVLVTSYKLNIIACQKFRLFPSHILNVFTKTNEMILIVKKIANGCIIGVKLQRIILLGIVKCTHWPYKWDSALTGHFYKTMYGSFPGQTKVDLIKRWLY